MGEERISDCQFVDVRATVCWEQFVDLVDRSSREFCWGEISRLLSVFAMGFGSHVVLDAVRGHYAGRRLMLILLKDRGCGCGFRYLAAAHEGCSCCGLSHESDCVGVVVVLGYLHTTILKLMLL